MFVRVCLAFSQYTQKRILLFGYLRPSESFCSYTFQWTIFFFHFSLMDIVEWTNHFCSWVGTFFFRFQFNNHYSIIFASLTVFLWNLRSWIVLRLQIFHRCKKKQTHSQKDRKSIFQVNLQLDSIKSQLERCTLINSNADFHLFLS